MPCVISVNPQFEFQIKSDLFVIGGSTTHSVVEELRSAPESELETAGSSDHLHKLTLKSHGLKIPSKAPHQFRDVWEASREHGVGVRLSRMKQQTHNKRCIHMNVQIPLVRLNGPDSSRPYGRLKLSTPEWRGQFNLTNDQKEKSTIPASMSFCLIVRACLTWSVSWAALKKGSDVVAASSYAEQSERRKKEAQYCGQLFNKSTSTGETRGNGQLFHFA